MKKTWHFVILAVWASTVFGLIYAALSSSALARWVKSSLWQIIVTFSLRNQLISVISNQLNWKLYNFTDFDIPVCLLIQERVNYLQQIIDEQT